MKFLITEGKFENVVFSYLNDQNFITIKTKKSIHFVYNTKDKFAQIVYDLDDGYCYVWHKFMERFQNFFSFVDELTAQTYIGKWVETQVNDSVENVHTSWTNFFR